MRHILDLTGIKERVQLRMGHIDVGLRGMEDLVRFHEGKLGIRVGGLRSEVLIQETSFVWQVLVARQRKGNSGCVVSTGGRENV
jgi:hypothetical protein